MKENGAPRGGGGYAFAKVVRDDWRYSASLDGWRNPVRGGADVGAL